MITAYRLAGVLAAAGVAAYGLVGGAHAITNPCNDYMAESVTGYVGGPDTTNTTCGYGSTADNDNQARLNSDMLGGISNWVLIGSVGSPGTDLTIGGTGANTYTNDDDDLLGTWSIAASLYNTYSVVAFVMKDGTSVNTLPPSWIGYLTNLANSSGAFRSPFINTSNGNPKDISHFSLYGVVGGPNCPPTNPACGGEQQPVPLPAAFPLFATALGGLGLLGWRRKRKAAAAAA